MFEVEFLFSEKNPAPNGIQLQTLVPIEGGVVLADVDIILADELMTAGGT